MSGNQVIRKINRVAPALIAGLGDAGVATVHEAYGRRGLMNPGIRPIQMDNVIAGPAVTVLCPPGDNMMIHAAVEVVEEGDVLVVATTSHSTDGMFGDLIATSLMSRGCVGLVIDAGVRDTSDLRRMGFSVWSKAVHAQGTVKATAGSVNVPIVCGGINVDPGDVVIADDDGVVVVSGTSAASTFDGANARLEKEEEMRVRLQRGELALDLYGLRDRLGGLGVTWTDDEEEA